MSRRVTLLTGGVGGAKLALGLYQVIEPAEITAIVNTGDDFQHLGLHISPDVDTLLYTLSGKANASQGWGREGESWSFMAALRSLGQPEWFALGDGDLALHVTRTMRLGGGDKLSSVIADFARAWGIEAAILPMSNDAVATRIDTDEGLLDFQHYFVERRCEPVVRSLHFEGSKSALPAPNVLEAIERQDNRAILIAPSNPFLSIDPILAVPGIRAALAAAPAPVVAISPLIGGQAVKGPTDKIMGELGMAATGSAIADHYDDIIDGLIVDIRDPPQIISVPSLRIDTLMQSLDDRMRVAEAALGFADTLA